MKTQQFKLDKCQFIPDLHKDKTRTAKYLVPILPAFSIEYAELIVPTDLDGVQPTHLFIGHGFEIYNDTVRWHSYRQKLFDAHDPILIVHYHGIRDYQLLFPAISSSDRIQRLANYYEEADKCFEAGAWLSFMLMCGAVFEGLLFDRVGTAKLGALEKLIIKAKNIDLISDYERQLMDRVREYRNVVHLNRNSDYVSRADVMDTRTVLDAIVHRFSYGPEEAEA